MTSLPARCSLRLPDYDYSSVGVYFATVCADGKKWTFGRTIDSRAELTRLGHQAVEELSNTGATRSDVTMDEFIIAPLGRRDTSLGSLIAGFKAEVTSRARRELGFTHALWQRNYYERVVRNERELAAIREYIANNPATWAEDDLR